MPSLFLEELPEELLRKITPAPAFTTRAASPRVVKTPDAYARSDESVGGFRIGQNVQHTKFGAGVIVSAEGRGGDARVQVNFGAQGMKWLALEYAKLTPC